MARARQTSKKAAEYAARADEALAQRKALVSAIGAAEEKYEQQQDAVAEAQSKLDELATEVADAYNNAIDGGWTAAELKALGITKPDAKPAKSPKSSSSKSTHHEPNTVHTNPGGTNGADAHTAVNNDNSSDPTHDNDATSTPDNTPEPAYQ